MDMIRAFIAIPLPHPLLERLEQLQRQLQKQMSPGTVRWVRPEGIHLTLKFLGDTSTEKIAQIKAALLLTARGKPTFTFTVGDLGCFPNPRSPRVVWVGTQEPSGRLATLQDAVEATVAPFGYPPEGRGFTPHLTLGRVQQGASRSDVARIGEAVTTTKVGTLGEVTVDRFALIRSVLQPGGAVYTTLAEFRLEG